MDITEHITSCTGYPSMHQAMNMTSAFADKSSDQIEERVYYGNAEVEGDTVILGGVEIVVGGWTSYEATRREARWMANPRDHAAQPRSWYGGRTYISGQDAVESLVMARCSSRGGVSGGNGGVSSNQDDPLARSAERLTAAITAFDKVITREGLGTVWTRLGIPPDAPVAISTINPKDIQYSIQDTDVNLLHRVAEDAGILASSYARDNELPQLKAPRPPGDLPPMPIREVSLQGRNASEINRSIANLEKASIPRAVAIETYRGKVAAVFDTAAAVLERSIKDA